jgi:hypothetical protein
VNSTHSIFNKYSVKKKDQYSLFKYWQKKKR